MSDGMRRELVYLSSYATNRYFIPNWGKDVTLVQFSRAKHEMVMCGRRSELNVTRYALIAMDARMHLYTAFLLSCLGIASHALEYEVREEADGRRIDDLELLHSLGYLAGGAVR